MANIESLSGNCRWQDIVSLYHPVEEKLPELDEAGMADMIKEKIASAMGHPAVFQYQGKASPDHLRSPLF